MNAERTFAVSFFSSKLSPSAEVRELSWAEMRDLSLNAERSLAAKEALPMWSPAVFSGPPRIENVASISALVLDVDGSPVSRSETVTRMPFACIAHASFSHSPMLEKFRLMARTTRSHTAAEHPALWAYAQLILGAVGIEADTKARDASRRFFVPVKHAHYGVTWNGGQQPLDVDEALAFMRELEMQKASQEVVSLPRRAPTRAGGLDPIERASRYLAKMDPCVEFSGGDDQLYRAAIAMVKGFDLPKATALELLLAEFNPRCVGKVWPQRVVARKVDEAGKSNLPVGYLLDRGVAA